MGTIISVISEMITRFSKLRELELNFSFAAKVLIYIIKIITPPKNTKTIK